MALEFGKKICEKVEITWVLNSEKKLEKWIKGESIFKNTN